jgi:uncharacterized protein YkwD
VGGVGENISYGMTTGRDVVLKLLVDDGVLDRRHRTKIFNADFKLIGSFSSPHNELGTMTCVDYGID